MGKDRTRRARKGRPIPVSREDGPGSAHTAGTYGENVPRRHRNPDAETPGHVPVGEPDLPPEQEEAEEATEGEALSGSGREASGSLPGSVGGTTGTGGENAGIRSPGAAVPDFPGISPGEAERLRRTRE